MTSVAPRPDVTALPGTAAGAVVWRHLGRLRVTVIAKATFALVHDATLPRTSPRPLITSEVHHGKLPNRSIRYATDLAPRLDRADVVLTGHAHVPAGKLPRLTVRLALFDGPQAVLDKRLIAQDAAGFSKMPIVYERAKGGVGHADNPLGCEEPTIVHPGAPGAPAGFGPIARSWPARRKLLGSLPRKALDAPVIELPDDFDFRYFQAAPQDQQAARLRGDEWLLLEGMHVSLPVIRARLPGGRAVARIDGLGRFGIAEGSLMILPLDTVRIDADDQWCELVFRQSFAVPGEEALGAARVVATVELEGDEPAASVRLPAASPGVRRATFESTIDLSDDDLELAGDLTISDEATTLSLSPREPRSEPPRAGVDQTLAIDPEAGPDAAALPFSAPAPPLRSTPPPAPPPIASAQPPAPRSLADVTPPPPPQIASAPTQRPQDDGEQTIEAHSERRPALASLPFDPNAAPSLPEESPPPRPRASSSALTYVLEAEEEQSAAERAVLPFITATPRSPSPEEMRARGHEPTILRRASSSIPFFTRAPFTACALPWQLRPGHEVRTVVVKATFDLVQDGAVKQREEADPPCGDLHHGDDPARSLLYASDLAVFKPRADVTLTGHAYAPGGSSVAAEAVFRFGRDKARFERRIAVFGDRFWQGGLVPTEPLKFDRMPLVYERAYGGADHVRNPLGRGRAAGADGRSPLPNLEDRDDMIKSPTSAPRPVCFAPVPAFFRERAARLGTFGAEWRRSRWPYFPDDFDWAHYQHAPEAQQLDALAGDEPFELIGVLPDAPRLAGKLAGAAPRAFAQKTTAAGGLFFEIVLRLDTVAFDADRRKVDLVWRGLLDVEDEEASDIAEIYVLRAEKGAAPIDLQRARARYRAERGPWPVVPLTPETPAAANAAPGRSDEQKDRVAARLRAAGVPAAPDRSTSPPPADVPPREPRDDAALRAEVRARLADGRSLEGLDLESADLSGLDFRSQSLATLNLKEARLAGCSFVAADLQGAVLAGADLTGAVLERAVLAGADLTGARLEQANLDEADLSSADLSGVSAEGATFRKARGAKPRFTGARLDRARFDGADLRGADFTRATLDGAVLDDLRSPEIRLYDARAVRASYKRADLTEARADGACLVECSFALAKADASVWDGALLDGSTFLGASLAGAGFARASCDKAVLTGAELTDARLPGAALRGAQLLRANLLRASLEAADLTGADLRGANLHGAETWKAKLRGAKLDLAIVTGTKLARERA